MDKKGEPVRVVIAHPLPEQQQRIASILERDGLFSICHTTHDGLDCLRETISEQPGLLILNTVLDKIDGLEVLHRLKEFPLSNTKCLILTSYSGYVRDYALHLGADHCLMEPYLDGALAETARMLVLPPDAAFTDAAIDNETARILQDLGIPTRLKGYDYTLAGVRILIRDPGLVRRRRVIKELYGAIGRNFGVSDARVERTLRTLTARVFSKGELDRLAHYFAPADVQQSHITNSDFLATLADLVRRELTAEGAAQKTAAR